MDIMPHIKVLLDDIIKMTDHIVVKRSDLADRYDGNKTTKMLYQQCVEVLDGSSTFYTHKVYPEELLRSYSRWVETDDISQFGSLEPLTVENNKIYTNMINGSKMTITNTEPFERYNGTITNYNSENVGNGWVQLISNGYFQKVENVNVKKTESTYNIVNMNNEELLAIQMNGNKLTDIKQLVTYVKIYDIGQNAYVPVQVIIDFTSEYVLVADYDANEILEDNTWIYEKDNNNNFIYYKDNPYVYNEKIICDESEENKYYLRHKINLRYVDERFYKSEEYINAMTDVDLTKYIRSDNKIYYQINNSGIYTELFSQSDTGDYYLDVNSTEINPYVKLPDDYEIDDNGNLVVDENQQNLLNLDESLFYKINTDDDISDNDIYYRYQALNSDIVVQEETQTQEGNTINRIESDNDGAIHIYYNYSDENDSVERCKILINSKSYEENYIVANNISYEQDDEGDYKLNNGTYEIINESDIINDEDRYIKIEYNTIVTGNPKYFYFGQSNVANPGNFDLVNDNTIMEYGGSQYYLSNETDNTEGPFIYINPDCKYWISEQVLTDEEIYRYARNRNLIPEEYRNDLKELMDKYVVKLYCPNYNDRSEYAVPLYTGETNRYYREINGLPPLSSSYSDPRFNRKLINPNYSGTYVNPYIYEMTDNEIEVMENLGYLKEYQDLYPMHNYLHYLGKNRIDVIKARSASPYDILSIVDSDLPLSKEMFIENYQIAKNWVFRKHYKPKLFDKQEYYHAYIGFVICVLAMIMCITKSGEILIQNKFMDRETVDIILKSYGFNGTFDSIPLIYRREIAKNILKLIRNKGIDSIYDIVYSLFNMKDIEVYKYYFKRKYEMDENGKIKVDDDNKPLYLLSIAQAAINTSSIVKDITMPENELSYDDITSTDAYWGVYESDDSVKEKILNIPFNYMNSKYITLNNKFNLTELNFNSSYLLNYLLEVTKINKIPISIKIDEITNSQELSSLIITLFAIQSIKYGFDGNIPNDIISAASVYKFNLDATVTGPNGKPKKIIDYYIDYMTQNNADNIKISSQDKESIESMMGSIISSNQNNGSIAVPIYNNKNDNSVTSLANTYLYNLSTDNVLTNKNEDSLYNRLIQLRENSHTLNDFRCFDELIKCITVCEENDNIYGLDVPIWELMYENEYKYRNSNFESIYDEKYKDGKIYYTDIRDTWNLISLTQEGNYIFDGGYNPKKLRKIYKENGNIEYVESDSDTVNSNTNFAYYKTYYNHFYNINDNVLVTRNIPDNNIDSNIEYVIYISDLSRKELLEMSDISESKISIYKRSNLMKLLGIVDGDGSLASGKLSNLVRVTDINELSSGDFINVDNKSIGNNNIVYCGYMTLDEFINSQEENT